MNCHQTRTLRRAVAMQLRGCARYGLPVAPMLLASLPAAFAQGTGGLEEIIVEGRSKNLSPAKSCRCQYRIGVDRS
jgi:hypothetical protein